MRLVRFEFLVRSGRDAGKAIALLSGQTLTFGRLQSCDVQLDDESVSRRHCTLQGADDRCILTDLQSANGTFVNDRRITTSNVNPGDKLRIGATELEFVAASIGGTGSAETATIPALTLIPVERGQTVRKAVDPGRLEFLTQGFKRPNERALLDSAQRYLSTLHDVSAALARATSVESLFDSILSAILDVTKGDRAAILMRAAEQAAEGDVGIRVAAVRARRGGILTGNMVMSRTVVRDVLEQGVSTFTHDALSDERYAGGESVVRQRIRSIMCAPMRTPDEILGVLYVDSYATHEFNDSALELLAAIGNQAGIALHRARLLADMERLFLDMMKAMAAIIDAKDGYTHRHSERVAAFAVRLAGQLGLSAETRATVELSALLHDVGKIGIPDAILKKPGELTDDEYSEIRRHPIHGAAILSNIQSPKVTDLLPGVMYHHERWDGFGYPEGLKGEQIPLLGRILAVADVLDAMTSDRTYRKAKPLADVLKVIQEQSGRAFDPQVVAAAAALHQKGELALPVALGHMLR